MTDLMRDAELDREIGSFLAGYAEDVNDAPTSSEIAARISSRVGADKAAGLRLTPRLRWVLLAGLLMLAALGVALVGALSQRDVTNPAPPNTALLNGWIAYSTRAHMATSGVVGEIFLVREGTEPRRIAGGDGTSALCPSFSPDGTKLAYLRGGEVIVLGGDFAGSPREEGRYGLGGASADWCPVWSPGSDAIAVVANDEILLLGLGGSSSSVGLGAQPARSPEGVLAWSPDGTRFAVASSTGILIVPLDGTPYSLTASPAYGPAWSPDGSRLAFHERVDGVGPLVKIVNVAVGDAPLTLGLGDMPVWSPAGDEVAYRALAVAIQRLDGSDTRSVGVPDAYGFGGWSPDGTQLLQMVDVGGKVWDLVSATADGASTTVFAHRISTGSTRNFPNQDDVSWQAVNR